MAYAFNPSTKETEAGASLGVQSHPSLHSKFHSSKDYIEKKEGSEERRVGEEREGKKECRGEGGKLCKAILMGVLTDKAKRGIVTREAFW